MYIVYSVPKYQQYLYNKTSSESVLAEVAAYIYKQNIWKASSYCITISEEWPHINISKFCMNLKTISTISADLSRNLYRYSQIKTRINICRGSRYCLQIYTGFVDERMNEINLSPGFFLYWHMTNVSNLILQRCTKFSIASLYISLIFQLLNGHDYMKKILES